MYNKFKPFVFFFLLPIIIVMVGYGTLMYYHPNHFNFWIGILTAISVTIGIKIWSELFFFRQEMNSLRASIIGNKNILRDYEELTSKAIELINTPYKSIIYVYRGYFHNSEMEKNYFKGTVNSLEIGAIKKYFRIFTINSEDDIESLLNIMRIFSNSKTAKQKSKFYVNFTPVINYTGFFISGENNCLITLPDLSNTPDIISQHSCGYYIKDKQVANSYKEVFDEIRKKKLTEEIFFFEKKRFQNELDKMRIDLKTKFKKNQISN